MRVEGSDTQVALGVGRWALRCERAEEIPMGEGSGQVPMGKRRTDTYGRGGQTFIGEGGAGTAAFARVLLTK